MLQCLCTTAFSLALIAISIFYNKTFRANRTCLEVPTVLIWLRGP
jgi:hypothetical protein